MYQLIISRQSCEITSTHWGSLTLKTVAENLTSTPARACHDVMLWLIVTPSKFIFHNLNRKTGVPSIFFYLCFASFKSLHCLTIRDTPPQGHHWKTEIKVEDTITALAQLGFFKNWDFLSFCPLILLIIMLYWTENEREKKEGWFGGIAGAHLCDPHQRYNVVTPDQ